MTLYRETTRKADRFSHSPIRRVSHQWHTLYERKMKTIVVKDTPYGQLVTKGRERRCLICGKEEIFEMNKITDPENKYGQVSPREWKTKPTADDTTNELFDVPP